MDVEGSLDVCFGWLGERKDVGKLFGDTRPDRFLFEEENRLVGLVGGEGRERSLYGGFNVAAEDLRWLGLDHILRMKNDFGELMLNQVLVYPLGD